jgi:UDP-N-acetylglucosamine 2-epimerase (non-hydrolysing)
MGGIFGIWNLNENPIDLPVVHRATNLLHHRGPDDEGYLLGDTQEGYITTTMGCHRSSLIANERSTVLQDLALKPKEYLLTTVHRPYNTENPENLRDTLTAFVETGERIVFPVHLIKPQLRRMGWT